jgi:hypothetical protein
MMSTPIRPTAGRDPAAQADLLAEKDDRQRGDEQRRDEAGGGGFRDRQEAQAGDEEQRRAQQRRAAHQMQAEPVGLQRKQRRARHHRRRHDQREHQEPDPGDLDRGQRRERYFAVTSEVPRKTVEARISAMPLNGRSARAGALRAADFFSGNGNGALSSLAAAAGGGVTAISKAVMIESGEALKNTNSPDATRSENRMRICAIARAGRMRMRGALETLC